MTHTPAVPESWYRSRFELFEKSLNGEASSELHAARTEAMSRFADLGFPNPKMEEWRFLNLTPIAAVNFSPVLRPREGPIRREEFSSLSVDGPGAHRLVFVDGHYAEALSRPGRLPRGVRLESLALAMKGNDGVAARSVGRCVHYNDNAFTALNMAFLRDGAFVFVPDGIALEHPIELMVLATASDEPFAVFPRNLVVVGGGSRVTVVETYAGPSGRKYFTNSVTETIIGEQSVVEHDRIQAEGLEAFHIGTSSAKVGAGSRFASFSVAFGGAIARHNLSAVFEAEGSEIWLNGLVLASGEQVVDNHTTIDHARARCVSHELYKTILDGKARGVFNGKIYVRRDAQQTDAKQTNKTLLLSDEAIIDAKPQLEIFADDVKCTHGAAVGQLEEEQLFYLRSRGIGHQEARALLTHAFAGDVVGRIETVPVRERLEEMLRTRLQEGRVARE